MKLLLDTHALLWWLSSDRRLSSMARRVIEDRANEIYVSAVVAYEIIYKQVRGRLPLLPDSLSRRLLRQGFETLPVTLDHAAAAAELPGPHRDPWDRIMMAQAIAEQCRVVTVDKVFAEYGIPVAW